MSVITNAGSIATGSVATSPGDGAGSVYYAVPIQQPAERAVVFFVGDRVDDSGLEIVERLSSPANIANLLMRKSSTPLAVYVVTPARYEGPFACYEGLLPKTTQTGEPLGYEGRGLPASSRLHALLERVARVVQGGSQAGEAAAAAAAVHTAPDPQAMERASEAGQPSARPSPPPPPQAPGGGSAAAAGLWSLCRVPLAAGEAAADALAEVEARSGSVVVDEAWEAFSQSTLLGGGCLSSSGLALGTSGNNLTTPLLRENGGSAEGSPTSGSGSGGNDGGSFISVVGPLPRLIVMGFSKGGVVLNQMLAEMAWLGDMRLSNFHEKGTGFVEGSDFLDGVDEVHFLDVGLNCRGAYTTDIRVWEDVSRFIGTREGGVCVALHGTPRQWADRKRQWIRDEKDNTIKILQSVATLIVEEETVRSSKKIGLQFVEKCYFKDQRPSLRMHFEILEAFAWH